MISHSRGFTLIELMVVVAIIGILSSVVLSALKEARLKAADTTVKQEALQLRTILEQERTNTGTYTAIKNGGAWKTAGATCASTLFGTSQFASKAGEVCTKLLSATTNACGANCLYFQTVGPINASDKYSIMAYLPGASRDAVAAGCTSNCARYICVGSSGNQSISDGAAWTEDGCYQNP